MAIIMHPLTAKNGSPKYTANDYRQAINPLLLPSDGSAFNGLSGIRYGSPSPLVTVSGLTVTVKAHCGTVSPWDGLGAYTYAITTNTTVQLADSTNSYKIAVTVEDPSQSHGTTPRGKIEVFTAGTPDSNINGLVIAKINAGVASDAAPIIRNNTVLMARDLEQLNTIAAMDGQEAVTIADNAPYVRNGGMWKQKNVVINPYAVTTFTRSDGQLQVNNGLTLMRMTLIHNDFDSVSIMNDGNGANVTNLPVGDYAVYLTLPLSSDAGWLNLNIGGSSGITNLGPSISEQLTGGNGFTRLNLATMLRITQTNTKIRVFTNNNVSGIMREKGLMFITRLG
jgi:hypothetical protein